MNNASGPAKSTIFSTFWDRISVTVQRFGRERDKPMALPVFSGPARGLWFRRQSLPGGYDMNTTNANESFKALSLICQKGWTIWDCGSAEGVSTVLFSKFVGMDGLVVCFEPKRESFLRAYDNASLNGCNNILFHFATVGSPAPKHAFRPPVCARQLSLDEAYEDGEIPIPHLVRLDLEKPGSSILNFGQRLIREQRPILIVTHYQDSSKSEMIEFAQTHGYALQSLERGTVWNKASEIKGAVLCSPSPLTK